MEKFGAIEAYEKSEETKENKKTPLWVKIIAIILLIALGLSLEYFLLLHPINKLKLRFLLYDNFTIEIIVPNVGLYPKKATIYVDGNIMLFNDTYYEIDDGEIYTYHKDFNGNWQKQKSEDFSASDNKEIMYKLFNRRNYKRSKDDLYSWVTKDNVDLGEIGRAGIERYEGNIAIVLYVGIATKIYMCFTDFGKTHLTPPWQ